MLKLDARFSCRRPDAIAGVPVVVVILGLLGGAALVPACTYDFTLGTGTRFRHERRRHRLLVVLVLRRPGLVQREDVLVSGGREMRRSTCGLDGIPCTTACAASSDCSLSCFSGNCTTNCTATAKCTVNCLGGNCTTACPAGSTCTVNCTGGNCKTSCDEGSSCTVNCTGGNCSCTGAGCK